MPIVHKPGKVITEMGRKNWSILLAEKGKNHTIVSCVCCRVFTSTIYDVPSQKNNFSP